MLNKDQYNQDEYNDYYRQEAEGVDIRRSESQGSKKSKLILFLSLIALAIAGFFGFKMLSSSSQPNDTSREEMSNINTQKSSDVEAKSQEIAPTSNAQVEKSNDDVNTQVQTTVEASNVQEQVANAIKNNKQSNESMSPQEIAKIVALVMNQMNQQKDTQTTTKNQHTSNEANIEDDTDLMKTLSDTNVDTVQENPQTDYSANSTNTDTKIENDSKKIDTYNKVAIQSTSGKDELSKLSEQINNAMNEDSETSSHPVASTYTTSIKKEVSTRSNEMRIIIVKKGDTLGKIAKRAYGNSMDYKKIYKANPDILNRPDRIYIGQKLRIPK